MRVFGGPCHRPRAPLPCFVRNPIPSKNHVIFNRNPMDMPHRGGAGRLVRPHAGAAQSQEINVCLYEKQ